MGVSGLWDIIGPAGVSRSLTRLAVVDGYEANTSRKRAYRVGIDASIWYKHAQFSKEGENPELRLLFFRLRRLSELPIIPLFVFDGRERPKVKRGSRMGKSGSHGLAQKFKELLEVFGMEWRMAIGEAEAELAFLNRTGVIDVIMTDDADALVFGATAIMKNIGSNLMGNKSNPALRSDGKKGSDHTLVFTADAIRAHPDIQLSRGGMILFALLSGGDYDKRIDKFGKVVSHALARCGFGDELLRAFEQREVESLHLFFPDWRARMNQELATNSRGFLGRAYPRLNIPPQFPPLETLERYAAPRCSASLGHSGGGPVRDKEMNIAKIAAFCEKYFEWGTRNRILYRFSSLMWKAAVIRVLRRACLEQDDKDADRRISQGTMDRHIRNAPRPDVCDAVGTPASLVKRHLCMSRDEIRAVGIANLRRTSTSQPAQAQAQAPAPDPNPILTKIHSERKHVSTDEILEYRVEVNPTQFVEFALSGIKGTRAEPSKATGVEQDIDSDSERAPRRQPKSALDKDPYAPLRMWIPASMLWRVHPRMANEFEEQKEEKARRRSTGGRRKRKEQEEDANGGSGDDGGDVPAGRTAAGRKSQEGRTRAKRKGKARATQSNTSDHDRSSDERPPSPSALQPTQPTMVGQFESCPSAYLPSPPSSQLRQHTSNINIPEDDFPCHTTNWRMPERFAKHCRLNQPPRDGKFLFSFPQPDDPELVKVPGFEEPPSFECRFASLDDSESHSEDDSDFDHPLSGLFSKESTTLDKGKGKAPPVVHSTPSTKRIRDLDEVDDYNTIDLTTPSPKKRHRTRSNFLRSQSSRSSLEVIELDDDDDNIDDAAPSDIPLFLPSPVTSPPPSSPDHDLDLQHHSFNRVSVNDSNIRETSEQTKSSSSYRRTSNIFDGVDHVVDLTKYRRPRKCMP